jgi:hypothetical protein
MPNPIDGGVTASPAIGPSCIDGRLRGESPCGHALMQGSGKTTRGPRSPILVPSPVLESGLSVNSRALSSGRCRLSKTATESGKR